MRRIKVIDVTSIRLFIWLTGCLQWARLNSAVHFTPPGICFFLRQLLHWSVTPSDDHLHFVIDWQVSRVCANWTWTAPTCPCRRLKISSRNFRRCRSATSVTRMPGDKKAGGMSTSVPHGPTPVQIKATGCAFSRLTSVALAVTSAFPICPSALDSTAPIRRRPTSSTPSDPSAEVPTSRKLRRRRYLFLFSAKNANDVHWLPAGHLGAFFKCFLLICLLNEFLSAADSMLLLHLLVETKF